MEEHPHSGSIVRRHPRLQRPERLQGRVSQYLRAQGTGTIGCGEREYRFGVTDFIGEAHPVEGDEVSFVPRLLANQFRARLIRIETPVVAGDNVWRGALERGKDPDSYRHQARVRPPIDPVTTTQRREQVRCGSCRRMVIPRLVRSRSRDAQGNPRWLERCPRCRGSLQGGPSPLRALVGATLALGAGAVAITRSFFF